MGQSAPNDLDWDPALGFAIAGDQPASLHVSEDGVSWETVWAADGLTGGVVATDRGWLLATNEGLRLDGELVDGPAQVVLLDSADDGTLFAVTRDARVFRSVDAGLSWQLGQEYLPAKVHDIATSPDFARTRTLLLGTHTGTFWSGDAGKSWHPLPRFARIEEDPWGIRCVDCTAYVDETQGIGGGWLLATGEEAFFDTNAPRFELLVDGEVEIVIGGTSSPGPSWEGASGWKRVIIRALEDEVRLDAVEVYGEGELLPLEPADTGDTDRDETGMTETGIDGPSSRCEGCGGRALVILPLLLLARRREDRRGLS